MTENILKSKDGRLGLVWRILLFFVITILLTSLIQMLGFFAAKVFLAAKGFAVEDFLQFHENYYRTSALISSGAMLIGSLVSGYILLSRDGRGFSALGFYVHRVSLIETSTGLGFGILLGLVVVILMALSGGLSWHQEPGVWLDWFVQGGAALIFLALPAAAEEAFLRGYPLQALAEFFGPAWAVFVTSVVFAFLHISNPGLTGLAFLNLISAGILLGVVYIRTGSLWWATGVHLGWNWAHGYIADVPVSGLELMDAPFYEAVSLGPDWLGGGIFGPEGSVIATFIILLTATVLWLGPWLTPSVQAVSAKPLWFVRHDEDSKTEFQY